MGRSSRPGHVPKDVLDALSAIRTNLAKGNVDHALEAYRKLGRGGRRPLCFKELTWKERHALGLVK